MQGERKHEYFIKFSQMLSPYDDYDEQNPEKEEAACSALKEFLNEFKKIEPDSEYDIGGSLHLEYLRFLITIEKALRNRHYTLAVHELITLLHYEPFLQRRIYNNLIKLLEERLE